MSKVTMWVVVALTMVSVSNGVFSSEPLTFDQRVKAQEEIERVYYNHRIWPADNTGQKPGFEEAFNRQTLSLKVTDYIKKSCAIDKLWQKPLVPSDIQAELDRIVKQSKDPEMLKELFAVLDNDPNIIAECLVRPILADRVLRSFYSSEANYHVATKMNAEEAMSLLKSGRTIDNLICQAERVRYAPETSVETPKCEGDEFTTVPMSKILFEQMLEKTVIGNVYLEEKPEAFVVIKILGMNSSEIVVEKFLFPKRDFDAWWSQASCEITTPILPGSIEYQYHISESGQETRDVCPDNWLDTSLDDIPDPRYGHTAVWTGTEMIVWGGGNNSGGRYNPTTDSWMPTSRQAGVPSARYFHTAVWTGSEMIIWGGWDGEEALESGGRYNPATDSWTPTSLTAPCPTERKNHVAVWSGTEMIVWSGADSSEVLLNDGGKYDPSTDLWTAVSTLGLCPEVRQYSTAVFISGEMIVWGGSAAGDVPLNTGGRYNPTSDSWTFATSILGDCPTARRFHSAVASDSKMLIWGGEGAGLAVLGNGSIYDPSNDTWTSISSAGAPSARRYHTAVWTSSLMVIWGGEDGTSSFQDGGKYDPLTTSWSATSTTGSCPTARYQHTAVWTGNDMIVWGGYWPTNSGGRYNLSGDTWSATSLGTNVPAGRQYHTTVWTGTEMIVWGGESLGPTLQLNTGGSYTPATDTWAATSTLTPCPVGRRYHTAIWTGTDMIVWGGNYYDGSEHYLNSGGLYNPGTDQWSATATSGAPIARQYHTAVWTGTEMIIWGGHSGSGYLNTGSRFDPATSVWTATYATGAPAVRQWHTAVWTGTYMIIWGGFNGSALNTGSCYDPTANNWTAVATGGPAVRYHHTAVWAPEINSMIVWGGVYTLPYNTGNMYNQTTKKWTAITTVNAPTARKHHAAVWTGQEMIVWGGLGSEGITLDDGARLNAYDNAWTALSQDPGFPTPRYSHTVVWNNPIDSIGQKMIVWGGSGALSSGGIYEPPPQVVGFYEACGAGPVELTTSTYSTYQWLKGGVEIVGAIDQTYSVTETGDYNVRVTLPDMTVCEGISHHVDIWGWPVPEITGNSSGCATPGVVLDAGTFITYQWILNGADITNATSKTYTAKTSGDYQVRVTDTHGCVGTSVVFPLTIYDNPVPIITGTSQGCPTLLSTEEWVTYEWKLGTTVVGASATYLAVVNGSYTVTVTDINGCVGTSDAYVVSNYPTPTITGSTTGCEGSFVTLSTGDYASYQWYSDGVIIDGALNRTYDALLSGSYTVEVTDALGCAALSPAKVVTFYPLPQPTIEGPLEMVCIADLSTQSFTNYQWIRDGSDITGANSKTYSTSIAGTYNVRVTDSHGCVGTSPDFIVSIFPLSEPPTVLGPASGCSETGVTLSTGVYSTYQWYVNGAAISGATGQSYLTTETGFNYYTVSVTDINGCASSTSIGHWVNLDSPKPDLYLDPDKNWVANGNVHAYAQSDSTLYIGGEFTCIGPYTGSGVVMDSTSGVRDALWPKVNGSVNAVAPDGTGGFYMGGEFTKVGSYSRSNFVHLKSDKSVDQDFAPSVNGVIWTILVVGTKVYVGGAFTVINTQTRNRLAAFDSVSGQLTAWNPNINNIVYALAEYNNKIYAGGSFLTVGGTSYNRLVAIDADTALADTWNPNIGGIVRAVKVLGTRLFIGGDFTTASATTRNRLAAYDLTTGLLISDWNPNSGGNVYSMDVYDDGAGTQTVYIGGVFTTVNGQPRAHIAAIDATGTATPWVKFWDPQITGATGTNVAALKVSSDGGTVYAGGFFTTVKGTATRTNLASIDASTGNPNDMDPIAPNRVGATSCVKALAVDSTNLAVGGDFISLNGSLRNKLAAIDLSTGQATSWDPNLSGTGTVSVYALALHGTNLYIGGNFTLVGGSTTRNRIASYDTTTGALNPWDGNSAGIVRALLISGDTLYVGGEFLTMSAQTRNRLASFDLATGALTGFYPNMNQNVYALAISGNNLYAGGAFTIIGGTGGSARNRLATIDITTGLATSWDPSCGGVVRSIVVGTDTIYAGGDFTTANVTGTQITRLRLAAFDPATGIATSWNPGASASVYSISASGDESVIYAGGNFTTAGGLSRNRLAAIDAISGEAVPTWDPGADGIVYTMLQNPPVMIFGGAFTNIRSIKHPYAGVAPLATTQCYLTLQLSTDTFASYQWFQDGVSITGATSQTYTASDPGLYNVEVTRTGGCIGESSEIMLWVAECGGGCVAPMDLIVETVNDDKSGFKWTDIAGADHYRSVRALQADLSAYNFACHSYPIDSGTTGLIITGDNPQAEIGRCYYYIVHGYDCDDPDEYLSPAGDGVVSRTLAATTCDGD